MYVYTVANAFLNFADLSEIGLPSTAGVIPRMAEKLPNSCRCPEGVRESHFVWCPPKGIKFCHRFYLALQLCSCQCKTTCFVWSTL